MSLSFCPTLESTVSAGYVIGASGKKIELGSMSSINNILTLRQIHLKTHAKQTLEIGLRMGGSALTFTQTHKDLGFEPIRQHVAIDPYQRYFNDSSGLLQLERAGLSQYLDFREDYSCRVLPQLLQDKRRFSMIYVDGSHVFEDVFVDMYYSIQLLTMGGILLFDDSFNSHIKKVLRFIRRNLSSCVKTFDLLPFRKPSLKYQIASFLGRVNLTAFQRIGDFPRPWDSSLNSF